MEADVDYEKALFWSRALCIPFGGGMLAISSCEDCPHFLIMLHEARATEITGARKVLEGKRMMKAPPGP